MDSKYLALVNLFLDSGENVLSAGDLAKSLGVSARTVLRYISYLNSTDKNESFRIIPIKSRGFRLQIIDQTNFSNFLKESAPIRLLSQEKYEMLFMIGLLEPTIQQLEKRMNYSEASISRLVNQLNEDLGKRHIKVTRLSNHYYVTGNEIQIRNFLQFVWSTFSKNSSSVLDVLQQQWEQFRKVLKTEDPSIDKELVRYLYICWIRIINKHSVELTPLIHSMYELPSMDDRMVLRLISYESVNSEIQITSDERILMMLALHNHPLEVQYNDLLNTMVPIITDILRQNDEKYGTEFQNDELLINSLACHISGNMTNYILSLKADNTLLDQIRLNYTSEHIYALELANSLSEMFGLQISDDDIGYFTLHFASSSERRKKENETPAVILYSKSYSTAQLLEFKLKAEFPSLKILGLRKADDIDSFGHLQKIGLLFVAEPELRNDNTIFVSPFINEDDKKKISRSIIKRNGLAPFLKLCHDENYFILSGSQSKDKVLDYMTSRLIENGYLTGNDAENILQREKLSSTEIALNTAFPHCLIDNPSFLAITILKQPVLWDKNYVRLVLLMGINKNEDSNRDAIKYLFDSLTSEKIRILLESADYKEFITIIGEEDAV